MAISIIKVAEHYAELPHQDRALQMLQAELSKTGLTADTCEWVKEFRSEPEAPKAPAGMSIAAKESQRPIGYNGAIDWRNPRCYISKYFTVAEVTQMDRRRIPIKGSQNEKSILVLAKELDLVREAWGGPLGITSWNRPEPINSQVGGADGSRHCLGLAADVYPMDGDILKFQAWIDRLWGDALGYGAKKGFVHLDVRSGGGFKKERIRIRWNY